MLDAAFIFDLDGTLVDSETELQNANHEAETKMELMVQSQAEAERQKRDTAHLKESLEKNAAVVAENKRRVEDELSEVAPQLERAKTAVSQITDIVQMKRELSSRTFLRKGS